MATKTVLNVSPRVFTGGLCGLGVAVVEAVIVAVNPHTLAFLGQWEPLALAGIPPLLGQVAAWFKKEQAAEESAANAPIIAAENAHVPATEPVGWVGPAPVEPLVPQTADQIINGTPAA